MAVLLLVLLLAGPPQRSAELAARGWQAFEQGRIQDAETDLEEAAKLAPASPSIALALGQVYLNAGKAKLAAPQLEKAARGLKNPYDVRFTLAQTYQTLDEDTKALAVLSGPAPGAPLREPWEFTRGFSLFRLGRIDAAGALFRTLLHSERLEAPANFFMGNCLYARKQYQEALPFYQRAIAVGKGPDNKALNAYFYNQGLALYQLNRFERAAEAFRRSIDRYSKDPLPWLFLGRCESELGQFTQAIEALESSIRLQPDLRLAYYQLARLHSQYGDKERAKELFQKVAGLRKQELDKEETMAQRLKVSGQ